MSSPRIGRFLPRLLLLLPLLVAPHVSAGSAATPEGGTQTSSPAVLDEENRRFFTDLPVLTHEGRELRFYSDLLKDRTVIISFFYTRCPTAQPALATLFRLQKMLGPQQGEGILLLSISVDPENDSVEAIREYAAKFNPRTGWLFLTGKPEHMNVICRRLGNTLKLPEGHLRLFMVGNLRTGHWMKLQESAPPRALAEGLQTLSDTPPGKG